MEEMANTVDKLQALFQKADSDLNYVSRKLDAEFSEMSQESSQANPKDLVERLQSVKKEYANIVKEAEEIQKAQQEAAEFFKSQLQLACQTLQKIQEQTGTEAPEKSEEVQLAESLLGLHVAPESQEDTSSDKPHNTDGRKRPTVDEPTDEGACAFPSENSPPATERISEVIPAERRSQGDFVEVSQEEFMTVSSLVRGRVKLEDVNRVYQRLYQHFREERNEEPLTTQDMSKMSMRITGATGEAKLKVLRSLKIISLNTKGHVKLL
ncbi:SKA complex subunit 2-like [Ptychodera flava]|uniref:SKA complex subunit 2-like n=1 Tax=Ptychodera flava TaxID=63121 RepID=UPI00396A8E11